MKKKNEIMIFEKGKDFWTTSTDVADKFGKRHDHVMASIEKLSYMLQKDVPYFREIFSTDSYGRKQKAYEINRDGFSLLVMGFTGKKALEWKVKYIKAFNRMEKLIRNKLELQAKESWQLARKSGKVLRIEMTDAVQELVSYAEAQGSKNANRYYGNITKMEYKALFYIATALPQPNKMRDLLNEMQLAYLATAESLVSRVIRENINRGIYYKDIYQLCKIEVERFATLVGVTAIPTNTMIGHNSMIAVEGNA